MQKTLILLKPDAIERGLTGAMVARFEAAGLRIENCRHVRPTLSQLELHYADLRKANERAFRRTTASLENLPFIAVILTGPHAILKVRAMTGSTDPVKAPAGTIRGDYGCDTIEQADEQFDSRRRFGGLRGP
jgi:nucleoside-diphosphate kinase